MKKTFGTILAIALTFATASNVFASSEEISVEIDGEKIVFTDQQPININGRVMVPVRDVAEKMGWKVSFEKYPGNTMTNGNFQEESHVSMTKSVDIGNDLNSTFIYFSDISLEQKTIISGNSGYHEQEKTLLANPTVQNDRILLGVRDIAESLYADVQWNETLQTVEITTKPVEQFPNYDKLVDYIEEYRKAVNEYKTVKEAKKNAEEKQKKTSEESHAEYTDEMLRLVNEEREKAGIMPLELDDTLTAAANIRAKEICEVFDHTRPNGENFRSLLKEMGTDASYAGENINKGTFENPKFAMELWMSSKAHKSNILNPNYKYIGIGYAFESESNGVFDDTVSHWVQIFTD